MILVAESGSTKCDWILLDHKGQEVNRWKTMGFNPYFHDEKLVEQVLKKTIGLKDFAGDVEQTWFYGAGCSTDALRSIIVTGLNNVFTKAKNHVGHDLEAAAFALYSGEPLIACILGTGSNSCYFNGETIFEEVPSLAYILGDEGSAGFIGKRILADYLYKKLPTDLHHAFKAEFNLSKDEIINTVYNKPNANVYLASFGPFAGKHNKHPYVKNIMQDAFKKFLDIHVACFKEAKNVPISFVGSVAKNNEDILTQCLNDFGFKKGKVLAKPVDALVQYHLKKLNIKESL